MPKYYDQDCIRTFLLLSTLPMMICLSGRSTNFVSKMLVHSKKKTNRQSLTFFKVKFWPKPKIKNSANTKPLNLKLALYVYHDWRNALRLQKMSKNSSLKETGSNYGQKFVCSDNPSQNVWRKVKKFSKIGKDFKNLLSNFACFLTAIVKV